MKKFALTIALLVLAAAMLTGCGSKPAEGGDAAPASAVVGTWALTSGELQGVEVPLDAYGEMTFEFKDDGTVSFSAMGQSESTTYTEADGKVTIEGQMELTLEDGNLVLTEETSGVRLIFTKK